MRLTFATTPEERFVAEIDALQATLGQLPEGAVRQVLADLAQLRGHVLGEIASSRDFSRYRLTQIEARLQDLAARFLERYTDAVAAPQAELFTAGQDLAAAPLVRAGVMYHVPQISTNVLEVVRALQARLITNATEDTIRAISAELRLGALRGDSVLDLVSTLAGRLDDPGPFGSLAARAEAITRTELGRIQSIATQAGLDEATTFVPDLKKQWLHSGNAGKWRRLGHIEAQDQIRDVDQPFRVRPAKGEPYELLMYPRAANGTPRSVVHCGCTSVPYRESWAAAIASARAEQTAFEQTRRAA